MNTVAAQFPHLDHFLNTYMHQDWTLFGDSIEGVIQTYVADTSPYDAQMLRSEIGGFIANQGESIESDYYDLFPNSVMPSGWDMKVEQWLNHVATLTGVVSYSNH